MKLEVSLVHEERSKNKFFWRFWNFIKDCISVKNFSAYPNIYSRESIFL